MSFVDSVFNFFGRRGNPEVGKSDEIIKDLNRINESSSVPKVQEVQILKDKRVDTILEGTIESVSQNVNEAKTVGYSPSDLSKLISSDDFNLGQILSGLHADISLNETYRENEEMSKDSVIGSAMEITADDICQVDERTGKIVNIESEDEGLQKFLEDFLENNVNIEERIWSWTYEVVKHGDFKLRRREYYAGSARSGVKSVYYEDVLNPYSVSRIEYMGNVLGYEDDDFYLDSIGASVGRDGTARGQAGQQLNGQIGSSSLAGSSSATFEKSDNFVHFLSSKLSRREKVVLNVKGGYDENGNKREKLEPVVCYKVSGTSIMDNARYIFRVINMLDNMLILSRVARSTQYNLVKIEVGNSSPGKTQQILSDVRRRLEGSTRLKKNVGMKTDPSPIPINSNVYIPTRDGKGDVTVDSVGDAVDVRSIVDIDYFKDKEFASIKFPKAYLGFEECLKYETKVRLLDGHVYEIGYMTEHPEVWQGKYIMTCSADGSFEPSLISHVKKTRLNATFVKVTLDNGEVVMVTPDHLMMMRDGTFKEAGSLVSGDSLMPFELKEVKVFSVEDIPDIEDAYDLGVVSENHTFPLEVGIFVHNSIGGVLGNNSLAKMDIRYARSVQRVQGIMVNGIRSLCNNYLVYRGRTSDVNKFRIRMRPITTSDTMGRVEEYITCMSVFDSSANFLQEYKPYIDKAKFFKSMLGLIGLSPSEIGSEEFMTILQEMEKGTYKEENHKQPEPEEDEGGGWK